MSDNLTWLQNFYLSLCDGEWEHGYGCDISNLDNPGWSFKFDLKETPFENSTGLDISRGEHVSSEGQDWLILKKTELAVAGHCGPTKLDELIGEFRGWIESQA